MDNARPNCKGFKKKKIEDDSHIEEYHQEDKENENNEKMEEYLELIVEVFENEETYDQYHNQDSFINSKILHENENMNKNSVDLNNKSLPKNISIEEKLVRNVEKKLKYSETVDIKLEPSDFTKIKLELPDNSNLPENALKLQDTNYYLEIDSDPLDNSAQKVFLIHEESPFNCAVKLELTEDSGRPNYLYLREDFTDHSNPEFESLHDVEPSQYPVVEYSFIKKQRAEMQKITSKNTIKKRPAKWLQLARIFCPNCKEERKKKRREAQNKCPKCLIPYILKCAVCNGNYKNIHTLSRHLRWGASKCNDQQILIKCEVCDFSHASLRYVEKHMEEKHGKVPPQKCLKCKKCGKFYANKYYKNVHQKNCNTKSTIDCQLCGFKCRCLTYFSAHMRKKHPEHYKGVIESEIPLHANFALSSLTIKYI